jgi:serine/threonine-protein kinase
MPEVRRDVQPQEAFELAGYEILGEIARGGMGVVYKARQRSLDRLVALKCLPPSFRDDPNRLARFQVEATAAAKLTKHGVVPVYDVVEAAGTPVLVMPYIEGSDLARILADRIAMRKKPDAAAGRHAWAGLPDEEFQSRVLSLMDRVIDALMRLHQADVLHRDIKPSNILVDAHGDGWLTDFGLARFGGHGDTGWSGTVGTPGYMSPEQWEDKADVDGRADVFSLGVTAYQALTLEMPYARKRVTLGTPAPVPPSRRNHLVTRRLDVVIGKAIHPERTRRYQSAAEFKEAWEEALRKPSPAKPGGWWRRASRRQRAVSIAAVAALFLLVCGAAWMAALWAASGGTVSGGTGGSEPRHMIVQVTTEPEGAMVVFVPLHPDTGEPQKEQAVRPPPGRTTPLQIELAPGPYFVEAAVDGRFHQVYRQIPLPGQVSRVRFPHWHWEVRDDGMIALPVIKIPAAGVDAKMASFPGSATFMMGDDEAAGAQPQHVQPVEAFLLDVHEVTVGEYRAARGNLPFDLVKAEGDDFAVTRVNYDEALHCAEVMGKRLPTEVEHEYAATMGGTRKFPWGDDKQRMGNNWPFRVVCQPDFDQLPTQPPVFGLYSNVAEWTTTWHLPYATTLPIGFPEDYRRFRTVRGGPASVATGRPEKDECLWGPRHRHGMSIDQTLPGLGFRCARSVKPLFLYR